MGTIRAVPMRHGLTLAEKLLGQALPDAGSMLDDSWEMGRLVLDPDFRAGPELLRRCLFMGLSFLHNQARVVNLHAACTPTLASTHAETANHRTIHGQTPARPGGCITRASWLAPSRAR